MNGFKVDSRAATMLINHNTQPLLFFSELYFKYAEPEYTLRICVFVIAINLPPCLFFPHCCLINNEDKYLLTSAE